MEGIQHYGVALQKKRKFKLRGAQSEKKRPGKTSNQLAASRPLKSSIKSPWPGPKTMRRKTNKLPSGSATSVHGEYQARILERIEFGLTNELLRLKKQGYHVMKRLPGKGHGPMAHPARMTAENFKEYPPTLKGVTKLPARFMHKVAQSNKRLANREALQEQLAKLGGAIKQRGTKGKKFVQAKRKSKKQPTADIWKVEELLRGA